MIATEARKAKDASVVTRRNPNPSAPPGKLAWIHWMSFRSVLVIIDKPQPRDRSNCSIRVGSEQGEQRAM